MHYILHLIVEVIWFVMSWLSALLVRKMLLSFQPMLKVLSFTFPIVAIDDLNC